MNQKACEIEALSKVDETSKKLQDNGFDEEALHCLQLGLFKRRDMFGPKSKEILLECKRVGQVFNEIALKNINASRFDKALEYLKHASKIVQKDDKNGKLVILQTFAECYRKMDNLAIATRYLKQAVRLQTELNYRPDERARSNLNVCANLSLLGKHEAALRYAQIAIGILRHEIRDSACQRDDKSRSCAQRKLLEMQAISEKYEHDSDSYSLEGDNFVNADPKYIETLAVAYYNTGVEYEHLGDIKKCYHFFQQGIEVVHSLGGSHHAIGIALKESSQAVVQKIVRESKGIIKIAQG